MTSERRSGKAMVIWATAAIYVLPQAFPVVRKAASMPKPRILWAALIARDRHGLRQAGATDSPGTAGPDGYRRGALRKARPFR